MDIDFARTDYDTQLERKSAINKIRDTFCAEDKNGAVFNLYGKSGYGKSYVCKYAFTNQIISGNEIKVLIDFNLLSNKNTPGIIETIAYSLDKTSFTASMRLLDRYYKSVDASKSEYLESCISKFIQELYEFADTHTSPVILIFDTFEALSEEIRETVIKRLINSTNAVIFYLISGIHTVELPVDKKHELTGFDEDEIKEYLILRNSRLRRSFKKCNKLLFSRIREFTNGGHPILCGLLSDCTLASEDAEKQIQYLADAKDKESSLEHLIRWVDNLEEDLKLSLRLTAYFNDRMSPWLLYKITGMPLQRCGDLLHEIQRFSFAKSFSEIEDPDPQIILHNIVSDLLRRYHFIPKSELHAYAAKAASAYAEMIADDEKQSENFRIGRSLRVEKVLCMVRNGEFEQAHILFDNAVLDGLDVFDYSFVNQLVSEVNMFMSSAKSSEWDYIVNSAKAEIALTQLRANDAVKITENLRSSELYEKGGIFHTLADNLFAKIIVNPCTVVRNKKPFEAIDILKKCIEPLSNHGLTSRLVKTWYWLGNAYVRTGQNDKAHLAYDMASDLSVIEIQRVNIMLEESKMLRLQQDVPDSFIPLGKCETLMSKLNKNKGKYFYYRGNAYRDAGHMDDAVKYYEEAFAELQNGDDDFTLCELNLDYAWLEYLRADSTVDMVKVEKYLNAGWNLAEKYHFGTEYSEYYHILYEIENYRGEYDEAYRHLEIAIDYAYKYSNIYMILDCLNHRAQMYYHEKRFDDIPGVLRDMKKIESRGCKIRVFRGRAKLVQADVYFDQTHYQMALQQYFEGFMTVALYGNSFTNVELFEDLYTGKSSTSTLSRKEKMAICFERIPNPGQYKRRFRTQWKMSNVSNEYSYFLENMRKAERHA